MTPQNDCTPSSSSNNNEDQPPPYDNDFDTEASPGMVTPLETCPHIDVIDCDVCGFL